MLPTVTFIKPYIAYQGRDIVKPLFLHALNFFGFVFAFLLLFQRAANFHNVKNICLILIFE